MPVPSSWEARFQAFSAIGRSLASCVVLVEGFHVTLRAGDLNVKPDRQACETW